MGGPQLNFRRPRKVAAQAERALREAKRQEKALFSDSVFGDMSSALKE